MTKQDNMKPLGAHFGLAGIVNIVGDNYLITITEAQIVGTLQNATIYKIVTVALHPFSPLPQKPEAQVYL